MDKAARSLDCNCIIISIFYFLCFINECAIYFFKPNWRVYINVKKKKFRKNQESQIRKKKKKRKKKRIFREGKRRTKLIELCSE